MHRRRSTERSRHERTCPVFLPRPSIFGKPRPFHQSTYPESRVRPASILQLHADSITAIQPAFDKWLRFPHRQTQIFSGIPLFCLCTLFFGCSEIFETSHKAPNRLIRSLCGALEMFFMLLSSSRSTTETRILRYIPPMEAGVSFSTWPCF